MPKDKMIRVLVVDDSATVRKWISRILTKEYGFEIVDQAINGEIGVEMARRLNPDIIVMDVDMPVMDGLRATETILREIAVPILVFTSTAIYRNRQVPFRALSAGALDVMLKPRLLDEAATERIADTLPDRLIHQMIGRDVVHHHPQHLTRPLGAVP